MGSFDYKKSKILIALSLSAMAGLIYEVVITNKLFFYFVESSYSIATVLSIFLFGLGVGSMIIYKYNKTISDKYSLFFIIQVLIGLYAFFVFMNIESILPKIHTFGLFMVSVILLLPPTIGLGAVFPLVNGLFREKDKDYVGLIYSVDLIGAVVGTLVAGFVLIPIFGNSFAIFIAVMCNLLAAVFIAKKRLLIYPSAGLFLVMIFFANSVMVVGEHIPTVMYPSDESQISEGRLFFQPSSHGEIEINDKTLYIDGRDQCAADYTDDASEKTIVGYALAESERDAKVLNIGLGCGLTAQSILDKVDKVDVVEINQVVVKANKYVSDVLQNKNLHLILDDGLHYVQTQKGQYDVIIMDVENPAVIHSSNLYTAESFAYMSDSLTDEGIFALWVNACITDEFYDTIYYTLHASFPHVYKINSAVILASNVALPYDEYIPTAEVEKNTIDHKVLSKIYFDRCAWWENEENILYPKQGSPQ